MKPIRVGTVVVRIILETTVIGESRREVKKQQTAGHPCGHRVSKLGHDPLQSVFETSMA